MRTFSHGRDTCRRVKAMRWPEARRTAISDRSKRCCPLQPMASYQVGCAVQEDYHARQGRWQHLLEWGWRCAKAFPKL